MTSSIVAAMVVFSVGGFSLGAVFGLLRRVFGSDS